MTPYRQQLITMGSEIIELWSWDPPFEMLEDGLKTPMTDRINAPRPIHERTDTTFSLWPTIPPKTTSTSMSNPNMKSDEDMHGEDDNEFTKSNVDDGIAVGSTGSPIISEPSETLTKSDMDSSNTTTKGQTSKVVIPLPKIVSWSEDIINSEFLPELKPTPFKRGTIPGESVNDTLMKKGLIDPLVYIQFLDLSLSSFSLP